MPKSNELLGEESLLALFTTDRVTQKTTKIDPWEYLPHTIIGAMVASLLLFSTVGRLIGKYPIILLAIATLGAFLLYNIVQLQKLHLLEKKLKVYIPEIIKDLKNGQIGSQWNALGEVLLAGPRWSLEISKETAIELDRRMDTLRSTNESPSFPRYIYPVQTPGVTLPATSTAGEIQEELRRSIHTRRNISPPTDH